MVDRDFGKSKRNVSARSMDAPNQIFERMRQRIKG